MQHAIHYHFNPGVLSPAWYRDYYCCILMFHHIPEELSVQYYLVLSVDMVYDEHCRTIENTTLRTLELSRHFRACRLSI
jgi:hypothetical protein